MTPSRFHTLLHKYLEGHATEEEEQQLFRFYASLQGKEEWDEGELGPSAVVEEQLRERLQQSIRKHEAKVVPLYRRPVFRVAAAAVLLFLVGSAGWWLLSGERRAAPVAQSPVTPATYEAPSGKASLVLGSGRVVLLDGRADGTVAREGSYHIIKQGQRIVYQPTGGRPTTQPHRLVTGKGRQWEVVLPDGSAAWLNTASELSFPASFARDERSVQLRGEAYFEVAKRTGQPFRVHVRPGTGAEALIEVLGTHFNVNAYT
ncbi:MAG TPA: FecR family protein, partial [Chitinophagaceae bacterium]|nr:FecR family protein [Chitinophagaceae bacterium]